MSPLESSHPMDLRPSDPARESQKLERLTRLMGEDAVSILARSHVMVFGLGGVGSYAVEALARSGVGKLTLVDFDMVGLSNFNRQLPATEAGLGQAKAAVMEARVRAIRPSCDVRGIKVYYDKDQAEQLFEVPPDFVVDCIDSVSSKVHLLATCHARGIPIVTSLGAAGKLDPTGVKVDDLGRTKVDPLGRIIRKRLRQRFDIHCTRRTGIWAVFSEEPPLMPLVSQVDAQGEPLLAVGEVGLEAALAGDDDEESTNPGAGDGTPGVETDPGPDEPAPHPRDMRKVVLGSAVFVTAVFGMAAASVVVRQLTGRWTATG